VFTVVARCNCNLLTAVGVRLLAIKSIECGKWRLFRFHGNEMARNLRYAWE